MSTAQKKMQNTCGTILKENEILKLPVDTYEREIEDLQQYSGRNCILTHRILEEREKITDELALDIFNNMLGLDVDLSELDTHIALEHHQLQTTTMQILRRRTNVRSDQ